MIRSRTAAEAYQQVLRAWAADLFRWEDDPDGKVTEISIRYTEKPCRQCDASDAEINISVSWEDPQGRSSAVTVFDSAETTKSLAEALTRLVPIAEEHGL